MRFRRFHVTPASIVTTVVVGATLGVLAGILEPVRPTDPQPLETIVEVVAEPLMVHGATDRQDGREVKARPKARRVAGIQRVRE